MHGNLMRANEVLFHTSNKSALAKIRRSGSVLNKELSRIAGIEHVIFSLIVNLIQPIGTWVDKSLKEGHCRYQAGLWVCLKNLFLN